jgi:hypothetical protein
VLLPPPPQLPEPEPGLAATQEQRAAADDWTARAVATPQPEMTQFWAEAWMAAVWEHWQAKSVAAQPRPEAAERRQDCWGVLDMSGRLVGWDKGVTGRVWVVVGGMV